MWRPGANGFYGSNRRVGTAWNDTSVLTNIMFLGRPLQRDGPYNRYGPSPGTKMSKISLHVIGWFNILMV